MTLLPPNMNQQMLIDKEIPPNLKMKKRNLEIIRDWLEKQPHLPKHMDDLRLEYFLFGCKNSVERCKMILERYLTARSTLPEFFAHRDPTDDEIQICCNAIEYFVLPSLSDEGHRVTVLRLNDRDIDKFSIQTITRRILMVMDMRLLKESCLSNIMIVDMQGWTAAHFAKCSPTQIIIRKAMLAVQDSMPLRLYRVIFINAPTFVHSIMNIFYQFLKPKLVDKFQIYKGGSEELWVHVNKDILPSEWGGNAGTFAQLNDAWRKSIEKHRDWFLREEKLCKIDESLRHPVASSSSLSMELRGLQGTFRQLSID